MSFEVFSIRFSAGTFSIGIQQEGQQKRLLRQIMERYCLRKRIDKFPLFIQSINHLIPQHCINSSCVLFGIKIYCMDSKKRHVEYLTRFVRGFRSENTGKFMLRNLAAPDQ